MSEKPIASLSLDLNNKWSYMKTHGDAGWETFPTYLDVGVPRTLQFFKERDLKITFFIVGQDAALDKNHESLALISEARHEIGNHSFNHEPWLHLYSKQELVTEFEQTGKRGCLAQTNGFYYLENSGRDKRNLAPDKREMQRQAIVSGFGKFR